MYIVQQMLYCMVCIVQVLLSDHLTKDWSETGNLQTEKLTLRTIYSVDNTRTWVVWSRRCWLCCRLDFQSQSYKPIVQILHLPGHWATSFREANGVIVKVYDSMLPFDNNKNVTSLWAVCLAQLRQIYGATGQSMSLAVPVVTQQNNGSDCGVFAIAYAVDLCNGVAPESRQYDRDSMRPHLLKCFINGLLTCFPSHASRCSHTFTLAL